MRYKKVANARKAISLNLLIVFALLNAAPFRAQENSPVFSADFKSDAATRAARNKSNALWQVFVNDEMSRAAAQKFGTVIADYDSFVVVAAQNAPPDDGLERVRLETEINLPGTKFEPLDGNANRAVNRSGGNREAADYFIVQFAAPATDEWLESVRSTGAEVVQYVPHNTFFVYAEVAAIEKVSDNSRVRWVGRFLPEDKISPVLRAQMAHARGGAELNADFSPLEKSAEGKAFFDVAVFSRADFEQIQTDIENVGGKIVSASKLSHNYFNSVRVEIALEQVEELARLRDVVRIDAFITPQREDERAAQILAGNYTSTTTIAAPGYNPLAQFGVNGNNVTVGVVDDGIGIPGDGGFYLTASNVVNGPLRGAAAGADGHGHLDASIIAGKTPFSVLDPTGYNYGSGIAPAAHLINIPFLRAGYTGTDANLADDTVSTSGVNGVRGSLSNNSWGSGTNGNAYDSRAAQYDGFARDASSAATVDPLLIVFSAGNSGTSGLTRPKVAKNVIAVAASENLRTELGGTNANNIDDIASFSSRGLAADGRIKPDIAAPGTNISGGRSGPDALNGNIDAHHRHSSGTSHAAPQIAGAAALFTQFWKNGNGGANPSPAMVKAALINGAVEINGVGSAATIPNGAEGWGRLNMKGMLNTGFPIRYLNQTTPLSNVGQNVPLNYTVADATKPLRVSLVWTDPPAVSDPALVNNLDLTVSVGGNSYKGNVFTGGTSATGGTADTRNNVENVFLPAGIAAGTPVSVQIRATALNGDGILGNADATDQHFALVVSNANPGAPTAVLASNGINIVSESGSPANNTPDPGETLTVGLELQNYGGANTGANVTATLLATGGITNPSAAQNYGTLLAGGTSVSKNFTFSVPSGAACGSSITLTFQVQDGATLFDVTQPYTLGKSGLTNSQNFDAAIVPALPTGWASTQSGIGTGWTTVTTTPASAPNAAFAGNPNNIGESALQSPSWNLTTTAARLDFTINYNTENTYDGVVLEIKIGAGAFQDIITAGGSFGTGGYNGSLNGSFGNPVGGRAAWTGNSGGYVQSSVNLPAAANNQSVQFRWRMGSDNEVAGTGVRLDDVQLYGRFVCATNPTAAAVSVGGRVLAADGKGVANARVTLTTGDGQIRAAVTNPFGYYRFDAVAAGETYVFAAAHRRFRFAPQVVSVAEDLTQLNFTAQP